MFRILCLLCITFVARASLPSKVIAGYSVDDAYFPFFVRVSRAVANNLTASCGGTIVNTRYILTVSHCLRNATAQNSSITVGLNSAYEKTYKVEKILKYDEADESDNHDIALLRTTEEIAYHNFYVQPVDLTSADFRSAGFPVEFIGYGLSNIQIKRINSSFWHITGSAPSKLQWLPTRIYDHEKCKAEMAGVRDERWICTREKIGRGPCSGDSGGPLMVTGLQIGIIARGHPCARGTPSIFTRIYYYLDWIHEQIKSGNHSVSATEAEAL